MTTTIPAKEMGADRDIAITFERWHSPELKVDVLTKRSDPPTDFDINKPGAAEPMIFERKIVRSKEE